MSWEIRQGIDLERQDSDDALALQVAEERYPPLVRPSSPTVEEIETARKASPHLYRVKDPLEKPSHVCFICIDTRQDGNLFAVAILCLGPTRAREKLMRVELKDDNSEEEGGKAKGKGKDTVRSNRIQSLEPVRPIYGPLHASDAAFEDDRAVCARLVDECYRCKGRGRKWIPYYGIINIAEVTVCPDPPETLPICDLLPGWGVNTLSSISMSEFNATAAPMAR